MSERFHRETEIWLQQLAATREAEAANLPEHDRVLRRLLLDEPVSRRELAALRGVHRACASRVLWEPGGDAIVPLPPPRPAIPPAFGTAATVLDEPHGSSERRVAPRLFLELPCVVHLRKPDATAGPALRGKTLDLSPNGMRLSLGRRPRELHARWRASLDRGEPVQVAVTLDGGKVDPGVVRGSVVWMSFEPEETRSEEGIITIGVLVELLTPAREALYRQSLEELAEQSDSSPTIRQEDF